MIDGAPLVLPRRRLPHREIQGQRLALRLPAQPDIRPRLPEGVVFNAQVARGGVAFRNPIGNVHHPRRAIEIDASFDSPVRVELFDGTEVEALNVASTVPSRQRPAFAVATFGGSIVAAIIRVATVQRHRLGVRSHAPKMDVTRRPAEAVAVGIIGIAKPDGRRGNGDLVGERLLIPHAVILLGESADAEERFPFDGVSRSKPATNGDERTEQEQKDSMHD